MINKTVSNSYSIKQ